MLKIFYVCNCCGKENINPVNMSQVLYKDRTLHQCEDCIKSKGIFYPVEKFEAINKYDVIENKNREAQKC